MKKVQEWTRDQGTLGFQALHDDKDTHALRHSELSLSVEAQVIKAKVRGERGGGRRGEEGGEWEEGGEGRGGRKGEEGGEWERSCQL